MFILLAGGWPSVIPLLQPTALLLLLQWTLFVLAPIEHIVTAFPFSFQLHFDDG